MYRRNNDNQTRRHRLIGHDYSDPGYYFITFGTKAGRELRGAIEGLSVVLTPIGQVVAELLRSLPDEFGHVEIDCVAIMPNHVHLLLYLSSDMERVSVSQLVRVIKGRSAAKHRSLTDDRSGLWHEGFHDEIVRDDRHLAAIRRYIVENPLRWKNEEFWK